MKLGKEMPAKATHHLNSQKGNSWRAQNNVWESIRSGKCTIAVFRPDMFEKLKLTISSAILFRWGKTWCWDWPAEKGTRALVLLGIFVTALCWEGGFPPFLQRRLSSWWSYLLLWPWPPLENSEGRAGTNDPQRRTDSVGEPDVLKMVMEGMDGQIQSQNGSRPRTCWWGQTFPMLAPTAPLCPHLCPREDNRGAVWGGDVPGVLTDQ